MRTLEASGLHLRRTLDSGQAFRWRWEEEENGRAVATGVVGRHRVRVTQDARGIHVLAPATEAACDAVARYFALAPRSEGRPRAPAGRGHIPPRWSGRTRAGTNGGSDSRPRGDPARGRAGFGFADLGHIESALAADGVLARVLHHTQGTGLLVQDPWEVLISFIVSQNNNIPKIGRSIEALAHGFGRPLGDGIHAFPSPARLATASPAALRACHLGYRAPYVRAAARLVAEGRLDLAALQRVPEDEARDTLRAVWGIGDKVADCVLLFGLGHVTAFPVDVWVRRAVERLYFGGREQPLREIRAFARDRFGPLAGYAQQHLFTYARAHLVD
ncbi:MAG TPA: DNA glycosylase [bacterium]|nr:DNA glycosylase [bacterium]